MNKGNDDKKDIAIIKLNGESIEMCKRNYGFITSNYLFDNQNINEVADYLVVGYPVTKTSIDYKRKRIRCEPFVYIMKSKEDSFYDKLGYDKKENILLGFNQRKSSYILEGNMNMSPNPKGISGCGLWYIPSYFTERVSFKLAGLMIEHYSKINIVTATKIEEVKLLLRFLN